MNTLVGRKKPSCMVPIFSVVVWVLIVGVIVWQTGKKPPQTAHTTAGLADPVANGTLKAPDLPPPEPDYVQQLRRVTEKRKLSFRVYCYEYSEKPDNDIYAVAWSSAGKFADAANPQWIVSGRSQEIAIRRLLSALKGPATWIPHGIPDPKPERKRECPPPIEGGPQ